MIEPQKLVFVIVGRACAKQVVKRLNRSGFTYHTALLGHGTAPSEMQTYFGLSEPEKTVLLCFTGESRTEELFSILNEEINFREPNTGIAFSVRVSCMAGMSVLSFIADNE